MTPTEFRAALAACGWTARQVARLTGRAEGAGTDWAAGRRRVPPEVADWLQRAAEWLERHPPPKRAA